MNNYGNKNPLLQTALIFGIQYGVMVICTLKKNIYEKFFFNKNGTAYPTLHNRLSVVRSFICLAVYMY